MLNDRQIATYSLRHRGCAGVVQAGAPGLFSVCVPASLLLGGVWHYIVRAGAPTRLGGVRARTVLCKSVTRGMVSASWLLLTSVVVMTHPPTTLWAMATTGGVVYPVNLTGR
jgi:hypothetical protein